MRKKNQTSLESKYWLLILAIFCVILMLLSWSGNGNGPLSFIANYSVIPMEKGINQVGQLTRDFTENFATLKELQTKNEKLQTQIDNLTMENNRLQQETYELERLQQLYKLDENHAEYKKVGAHVIGKDSGNWFSSFTIDKGSNDGLAVDMNVIAGTGLVGIITKVGPDWASVRSIIDDSSNVSAMVLSSGDTCMVSGDLKLMEDGVIKFEQLANNENEVPIGEELVTSHISSKYVQGISIGVVTDVKIDSNNLTRSGYITPVVDFNQLQEVLVITDLKKTQEGE